MIEDRIGELRLRVRTDSDDAEGVRPAAERVARAALERCAALLEARSPGRVVLVRRLPIRWSLDESALGEAGLEDELARAAADAIERAATPPTLAPPDDPEGAVIFEDEAQFRASDLLARARGRSAWYHEALESREAGGPLAALAAPGGRAMAFATLRWLAREGVLAEVLAAQPPAAPAALGAALGVVEAPPGSGGGSGPGPAAGGDPDGARLSALASGWPALAPEGRSLALRVHAALLLGVEVDAPAAVDLADRALVGTGPRVDPPGAASTDIGGPGGIAGGPAADPGRTPVVESDGRGSPDQGEPATSRTTGCAGLFYLLDRVGELDLAESLWRACLPEGAVLAAAASALLGPGHAGDAAPALFGGVEAVGACPPVAEEQLDEILAATCAALAEALPRRGLVEVPPVAVMLAGHPAGRLLVAAAEGSPWAFFARPADSPSGLESGLRILLDRWPARAELIASPGLARLDGSGRLRPRPDLRPAPPHLPEAPSGPAAALLAVAAGAPCLLFAARTGTPATTTAGEFVARHLALRGRVRLGPGRMDVILGADDVDLGVRGAGLDRDPGWVPWLRRAVRFAYESRDPAASPAGGGPR